MKTILLTGATGFLGSHLLKRLLYEGCEIVILKRSFSDTWHIKEELKHVHAYDVDRESLETCFLRHSIDTVIHTATNYGRKEKKASSLVQDNVLFPLIVLELAQKHNADNFINTDTMLHGGLNAYAVSKQQFVAWAKRLTSEKGTYFINMRLEHMYGPWDDDSKFVTWILRQLQQEVEVIPLTAGTQKRDFVYIDDVVEAYWKVLQHGFRDCYAELEVGSGTSISIREMVESAKRIVEQMKGGPLRTKLLFGEVPIRKGEPNVMSVDISKLAELGWKPRYDLHQGLKETIGE